MKCVALLFLVPVFLAACSATGQDPRLVERLAERLASPRLTIEEISTVDAPGGTGAKLVVAFEFIDSAGQVQQAKGKIFLPESVLKDESAKVPLAYHAGYEVADPAAIRSLAEGSIVATPAGAALNPMSRLPNLDSALLQCVRALPCVDDARVMITGGSAGGYTTLMLAAETFPLSAAVPMSPPINWNYNMRYFLANEALIKPPAAEGAQSPVPMLHLVCTGLVPERAAYYPEDMDDRAWKLNSPIAQLDTITCPVLAIFSTADVLVPVYQVSRDLVRPHDPAQFPEGFEPDPVKLTEDPEAHAALLDRLSEESYSLSVVPAGSDWSDFPVPTPGEEKGKPAMPPLWKVPYQDDKLWNIAVIDEGPMVPKAGHFRYLAMPDFREYIKEKLAAPIAPEQLTAKKLERLMARYAGTEWLDTGLRRLGPPEAERADVLRGLITYVGQGEAHARRFADLYVALPESQQALGPAAQFANAGEVRAALEALKGK